MEYETIESLYAYLKGLDPSKDINIDVSTVEYVRVVFTGISAQRDTLVERKDDWNNLNFFSNQFSKVGEVCQFLEPLLPDHGKHTVTISYTLIRSHQHQHQAIILPLNKELRWSDTHLNDFRRVGDLQAELDKLTEIVGCDNDIRLKWIFKRVPEVIKVYQVENSFHLGNLTKFYELYDPKYEAKLFKVHPEKANVLVCQVPAAKMISLFKPRSAAVIEQEVNALAL